MNSNTIRILALIIPVLAVVAVLGAMYLKYRLNNAPDNGNLEHALDLEVKKIIDKGLSHGLVVGVYKDRKSFTKGYGTVRQESITTPDGTTIFQIGSITKLFTDSIYQILADEKAFDMDARLNDAIGRNIELSARAKEVTLRQLASHTSGFPSIPKPLEVAATKLVKAEDLTQNPYGHLGPEYIFDYLKTTEDKREPGRFKYSNFGMGLLGHVLEAIAKKDLETLVVEKLLASLDMKSTVITLTPQLKKNLAQGYTDKGEPNPIWTFKALAGAGAFNSNADDMLKFIRANIETENFPISQSLVRTHELQPNGKANIGWMQPTLIDRFVGNNSIVWHNGMVGGYASYISVDTRNKTGVIVLSNKSVDVTMLGTMLTRKVRTQSWATQ